VLLLAGAAAADDILVRVTEGGEPRADALVRALKADEPVVFDPNAFAAEARTDERGEALLDAPAGGTLLVYRPGSALVVAPVAQVLDVALRPERVFEGTVVDDTGKPVPGARVRLRTTLNREATFLAKTDAQGRFFVYGLWLDNLEIEIEADGHVPTKAKRLTEVDAGRAFPLARTAMVRGTVESPPGHAVDEIQVVGRVAPVIDGRFEAEGLAPNEGCVARPPYPFGGASQPFDLAPGEVKEVEVAAIAPAQIHLRVEDAEGHPLRAVASSFFSSPVESTPEGSLTLLVPAYEEINVLLKAPGFEDRELDVPRLEPGATRDFGVVAMRRDVPVEVRVRLPDGTPAASGTVSVPWLKEPARVQLVGGSATVKESGWYLVDVPGHRPEVVLVAAPGPVEVLLAEVRWIEGLVLGPDGAPAPGARVVAAEPDRDRDVETTTDAEGRFRVGPLWKAGDSGYLFDVVAATASAEARATIEAGEGTLELTLREVDLHPLRGRVRRGEEPVRRFSIDEQDFVNEDGTFEVVLSRPAGCVEIDVDGRTYAFPLPPPGEALDAALPLGEVLVRTVEGTVGREVALRAAGVAVAMRKTGADGLARFELVAPGAYSATADGYRPADVTVREGAAPAVVLMPTSTGTLRLRTPATWTGGPRQPLSAETGVARCVAAEAPFHVRVEARIFAEAETVVDLDPPDAGSVRVRGEPGEQVDLRLRMVSAVLMYRASLDDTGQFLFTPLPPGRYEIGERAVAVPAGGFVDVLLDSQVREVRGRVMLRNGKPAQGAWVDVPGDGTWTDLRGEFSVMLRAGEHEVLVTLEGYAPGAGRAAVDDRGATVTPIVLDPDMRGHVTVLGLAGEPLRDALVRVNGVWTETDGLGRLDVPTNPATVDIEIEGCAAIRGRDTRDGDVIRLERCPLLTILCDRDATGRLRLLVRGQEWDFLGPPEPRGREGLIELADLPLGLVEVTLDDTRIPVTLLPGEAVQVDLRSR
jgi:hypothetical protein